MIFIHMQIFAAAMESDVLVYDENVQVTTSVDTYSNIVAGSPINGTIMITHNEKNTVDLNSFKLGGKPLKVELVQTVTADKSLILSIYEFKIDPLQAGVQVIPSVKVNVGGKTYESPPIEISVEG